MTLEKLIQSSHGSKDIGKFRDCPIKCENCGEIRRTRVALFLLSACHTFVLATSRWSLDSSRIVRTTGEQSQSVVWWFWFCSSHPNEGDTHSYDQTQNTLKSCIGIPIDTFISYYIATNKFHSQNDFHTQIQHHLPSFLGDFDKRFRSVVQSFLCRSVIAQGMFLELSFSYMQMILSWVLRRKMVKWFWNLACKFLTLFVDVCYKNCQMIYE